MNLIVETIEKIRPIDQSWVEQAVTRQLELTKPPNSLGRLEKIANRLCAIQETISPNVNHRAIFVFAADHGVCAENISPYPRAVTTQMIRNFLRGGAAINALARNAKAELIVVDIGVDNDFEETAANFVKAKIARGTENFVRGPALSETNAHKALSVGIELAKQARNRGVKLVGVGEMGIGNTTAASAVTAALLGREPETVTGRGTGADDRMLQHKIEVIKRALEINRPNSNDALDVLQKVGGLEIAGITGFCLGAAAEKIAIVTDGFIATAATALAVKICPFVRDYVFASHRSIEPGHAALLEFINRKPLFDLEMRLGEGTGAALAMNIIAGAVATFNEMATFAEASVSRQQNL